MAKSGRPQKPYETTWKEIVPGLNRQPDGRWRILATGDRFTESDERRAVQKFKEWQARYQPPEKLQIPIATLEQGEVNAMPTARRAVARRVIRVHVPADVATDPVHVSRELDAREVWDFLREQLIADPINVARMTGIPEVANLLRMDLPKASIRVADIIANYQTENPSTELAKRAALRTFDRFVKHTAARTVADLTKDRIHAFRQAIESDNDIQSAGTKQHLYGQIKSVISFGLKNPIMDSAEVRACLDRCKLLWTADAPPDVQPKPISRANFHALLQAAGDSSWRAWLLLGLNCAMYLKELCHLEWSAIDLDMGTLTMIRSKTRRARIPKVATLWEPTVATLRALPRRSKYVFTAPSGIHYASSQSRANAFADLRKRAGVEDSVSFAHLRDGAFTAACAGTTDGRLAKMLAGHSAGMEDAYVLRNPQIVQPACDAVFKVYGPFPAPIPRQRRSKAIIAPDEASS